MRRAVVWVCGFGQVRGVPFWDGSSVAGRVMCRGWSPRVCVDVYENVRGRKVKLGFVNLWRLAC